MTTPDSERIEITHQVYASWDLNVLRYTVDFLLTEAKRVPSNQWAQIIIETSPGLDNITLDFDNQGGIFINPETLNTAKGRELAHCLRRVFGDNARVGSWGDL